MVSGQEGNLYRQQLMMRNSKLKGGVGKVSSVGFGNECECEDVAQKVGTTILFRCVHSGDINMPLKNVGCIQPSR